jgi:hypothetical protein
VTRTPTLPPTDKSMWRRAIARTHPDAGGSHELCIWMQAVRDVVCGVVGVHDSNSRRQEASTRAQDRSQDSVPFDYFSDFEALTDRAVRMAEAVAEPYGFLLRRLADCYPVSDGPMCGQQRRGASYRSLAAIGHEVGMSKAERVQWYSIAESVPLSQRHAGHILKHLKERAA